MVLDEQAKILHKLLTDQSAKSEIKAECEDDGNEYLDIAMNKVIGQKVNEVLQEIRDEMFKVSVIDMLGDLKSPQVMKLEFLEIIKKYIAQYKEDAE